MKFLKNMFSPRDPLAPVRKALAQNSCSDALVRAEAINRTPLSSEQTSELDQLIREAGDGVAELNIAEGSACLRGGDHLRAMEHFQLAEQHARTQALAEKARNCRKEIGESRPAAPAAHVHSGSCGGCGTSATVGPTEDDSLDDDELMDLVLGSYPADLAERYRHAGEAFREAFIHLHCDRTGEALGKMAEVPKEERDDLYYFEQGALRLRTGEAGKGIKDLERALQVNPDNLLALEMLVGVEMDKGESVKAARRLQEMLERGIGTSFALGRLAVIAARGGDLEGALDFGLKACAEGGAEQEVIALTSSLLERNGRLDEAEMHLQKLSTGGCGGGGVNIPLAEFWLRHQRSVEKAGDTFRKAIGQDPENPRWKVRLGQVYLLRGWKKQGGAMILEGLSCGTLTEDIRREAEASLQENGLSN